MPLDHEAIRQVASATTVLRTPKQHLATFGVTAVSYYMVTEPVYAELAGATQETVVREGRVTAQRPQIVTPYYLLNLFRGFEHGGEFAEYLLDTYGPHSPGLLYRYENELQQTNVVSEPMAVVAGRLVDDLERRGENLSAVIRGVDHLWDISLMKFIYELTLSSLGHNVTELGRSGMLGSERGLPRAVRAHIETLFGQVSRGELRPAELKAELDRWGIFSEYEDRFLNLFRKR